MLITDEYFVELADSLSRTATSAEFLATVTKLGDLARSDRLHEVEAMIATVAQDSPLPDNFRVSNRTFEMPADTRVHFSHEDGVGTVVHQGGVITAVDKTSNRGCTSEPPSNQEIATTIRLAVADIAQFVRTESFMDLLDELYACANEAQPRFVHDVLLDSDQLLSRGISVPEGLMIQRSAFADGRPTLFCVTKIVPLAYPWHKVTITFDSQ
jgi:hypothetical protein